jgi:drug/metabolite transporter (DMT)-like permease
MLTLFIALRIIANPVSNVFQKQLTQRGADPFVIIAVTHTLLAVACLPWAFANAWDLRFWINIGIAALLAVAGNVLLVFALRSTDLSVLGPVNAYKAVVSLLLAVVMIGEIPSTIGLCGVLCIVAGSFFLGTRTGFFWQERGVQFRFAALVCSATEAVFLKKALLVATPEAAFVWWSILGLPVAWAAAPRTDFRVIAAEWRTYGMLAATTGAMQLSTLLTFGQLQVGYSLALFQMSTLLSVFFGYRFFNESNIGRRLAGALIMIAGALLIVLRF